MCVQFIHFIHLFPHLQYLCIIFFLRFKITQFNIVERFRYNIYINTLYTLRICAIRLFLLIENLSTIEHNIRQSRTLTNSPSAMLSGIPVRLASKSTVSLAASQSDRSTMQLYSMLLFVPLALALALAKFKSRRLFLSCIATLACCNQRIARIERNERLPNW